jgi:hypothetical protein
LPSPSWEEPTAAATWASAHWKCDPSPAFVGAAWKSPVPHSDSRSGLSPPGTGSLGESIAQCSVLFPLSGIAGQCTGKWGHQRNAIDLEHIVRNPTDHPNTLHYGISNTTIFCVFPLRSKPKANNKRKCGS